MIAAEDPPTPPASSDPSAKGAAIKALRKLANAAEVGVSFVEYGPLVIEAKTDLDTGLEKLPQDAFLSIMDHA